MSLVIGRKDKADFPVLDIKNLPVKIDSGAYSCSIHCETIEETIHNEAKTLTVVFLDKEHKLYTGKEVVFKDYKQKFVTSSSGEKQFRYFVCMEIVLFGETFSTDFSLTKRNGLRNPVLLGRKLLNKNFIIDTSKTNLSFKQKTSQKNKNI
jgi:hypothetical protein